MFKSEIEMIEIANESIPSECVVAALHSKHVMTALKIALGFFFRKCFRQFK